MDELRQLAELLSGRNTIDHRIARLINRPAEKGHIGEYIAARVFNITLHPSAAHKDTDGHFAAGPLSGCSVNVKYKAKHDGLLDMNADSISDYYLVLAGPRAQAISSVGSSHPWVIEFVFLFDGHNLLAALASRGVRVGVATSVIRQRWVSSEIYPSQRNQQLLLTADQQAMLALFR